MKIKNGFVMHTVGNENVVVAVGKMTVEFRGMIRLNETGAFLFKLLEKETDEAALSSALMKEYEISEETAVQSVSSFTRQLNEAGVLDI